MYVRVQKGRKGGNASRVIHKHITTPKLHQHWLEPREECEISPTRSESYLTIHIASLRDRVTFEWYSFYLDTCQSPLYPSHWLLGLEVLRQTRRGQVEYDSLHYTVLTAHSGIDT